MIEPVTDSRRATLSGNIHPLARPEADLGALPDATPLRRMLLLLRRSSEQELALDNLLERQQDPSSPEFHHWLSPEDLAATFGLSDHDLESVTTWLTLSGFTGISVNAARTLVEFSGTSATVRSAFRTPMHRYAVNSTEHIANVADPEIPAALLPVVAGIASLNNFPRRPLSREAGNFRHDNRTRATTRLAPTSTSGAHPDFTATTSNGTFYGVTPYDFATIYNVLPLWSAANPIDGTGQTIAIVSETDINPADFVSFRRLFNLPLGSTNSPTGTQFLNIIYNGSNPGIVADEGEADIDTQWSAAVAKGATIDLVVSASTETTQGTDLSAAYIVDNNLASVMSYSYGECEAELGAAGNAFFNHLWQQAAAQGITVMVSAGDSGSAGCDASTTRGARSGLAVNGLGSTPYNISVGGTDFDLLTNNPATYWSATNTPSTSASALRYIPETTWNETCTNTLLAQTSAFYNQTPAQVCTSSLALRDDLLDLGGGGGGPSTCTQFNQSGTSVVCSGGYAKPPWQTGHGVPADNARDTPDVSLFASSGFLNAFYIVCQQSHNTGGQPCSVAAPTYDFTGYGGTSVAAPAFAGILSLVNQKTGSRQGNANYTLYSLFHGQIANGATCDASSGNSPAGCLFNDISAGTIAQPCLAHSPDCASAPPFATYGILPGYLTGPGYDLATGLGSVNAANLVNAWAAVPAATPTATTLTLTPTTLVHGATVTGTVQVSSASGTPTGAVSIIASAANGVVASGTINAGTFTAPIASFPGGTYSVQAHFAGDSNFAASDSLPITLTVSPEASATALQTETYSPLTYTTTPVATGSTYPYGALYLFRASATGLSGNGTPTGNMLLSDGTLPLDGGTFRLNSSGYTEDQTTALAPGIHTLVAAFSGDPGFAASQSTPFLLTITRAPTVSTLTPASTAVSVGGTLTVSAQVFAGGFDPPAAHGYGALAPTGLLTLLAGQLTLASAPLATSAYPTYTSDFSSVTFAVPGSQIPAGLNSLSVSYAGDTNYLPSVSSAIPITLSSSTLADSITAIALPSLTEEFGASFTIAVAITPATPTAAAPAATGTATITSDGQVVGSPIPIYSGVASIPSTALNLSPGTHTLSAVYSGDLVYKASVSSPATLTVVAPTLAATITTLTATSTTVVQGANLNLFATVAPSSSTGTVHLSLDGSPYGTVVPLISGTAAIPLETSTLQIGTHTLLATYSGSAVSQPSASAAVILTVAAPTGSFSLTPSTASITVLRGTPGTLTLTAVPLDGFTAAVTFACTSGLPSGAACAFSPATLRPAGSPVTTALTLSAEPASTSDHLVAAAHPTHPPTLSRWLPIETGISSAACLLLVPGIRRRRRLPALAIMLVSLALGGATGCGGISGYLAATPTVASGGTPTGTYTVTVTAISGPITQVALITLTVQ